MTIDLEALRAKHAELTNPGGGGADWTEKYVQLQEGENVVRILPPTEEQAEQGKQFYAETAIHRIPKELTKDGKPKNFHCRKIHNEPCALCDAYYELWAKHNSLGLPQNEQSEFSKAAKAIKPRNRYYMNVIDRGANDKVKILSVGIKVFTKIIDTMIDEDYGDISDLETGHDFKVVKKQIPGQAWPAYDQSGPRPKPTKAMASKKGISEVMESMHDLSELVRLESAEEARELANIFVPQEVPQKDIVDGSASDDDYKEKLEV